jgi:hypothetical protein
VGTALDGCPDGRQIGGVASSWMDWIHSRGSGRPRTSTQDLHTFVSVGVARI